jgi:hypothetical protein
MNTECRTAQSNTHECGELTSAGVTELSYLSHNTGWSANPSAAVLARYRTGA